MHYALIDLGSNTVRLSVYQVTSDGTFSLLLSEKEMAGLVSYITNGVMSQDGINKACAVLLDFVSLLNQIGMGSPHVFATASLRNIQNSDEAQQLIRQRTGLEVDIISGQEEARLGYYGALHSTKITDGILFDIGGGSTEFVEVGSEKIVEAQSIPIGSLNLFNHFIQKIWPKKQEMREIEQQIEASLSTVILPRTTFSHACCIGGTARATLKIANMYFHKEETNRVLTVSQLRQLLSVMKQRDTQTRKLILNACPDRLHTIIPGMILLQMLTDRLCKKEIFVSPYGVREGYLCQKLLNTTT